jgi:hypothetical protein
MIDEGLRAHMLGYPGVTNAIGSRVYPAPLPQGATLPAVTYHDVSNVGSTSNDGPDCLERARYQLDHWAETKEEATRIERLTRAVLSGYSGRWGALTIGGVFRRNSWTLYEPETQLWRAITDYQINALSGA